MLLTRTEYEADKDRILNEVIEIITALENMKVYMRDESRALFIADYIEEKCKLIAKVYKEREDEIQYVLNEMADEYESKKKTT